MKPAPIARRTAPTATPRGRAHCAEVLTQDHGLVPGNRVLLRGGNTVEMALAWLGTVYAGLIAVATMPLLRAGELGSIIDRAQPTLGAMRRPPAGRAWNGTSTAPGAGHHRAVPRRARCGRPAAARTGQAHAALPHVG